MKKKFRTIILALLLFSISEVQAGFHRGIVVWNTPDLIGDTAERNIFINQCITDSTTDIYLYAAYLLSGNDKTKMQNFIAKASCHDMNVWAMDGFRGYFADWFGRWDYINFIHTVIEYNDSSQVNQRFMGVIGDNEPHDGQGEPSSSFHNDIPGSALDTTGGGVWQATQALDREFLMRDWINMAEEAYDSCHAHGLRYGQLMVSWLDDYYGEAVYCTYNGQYKRVLEHIMVYLDDFFSMAYNTNPIKAFKLVKGELAYADSLVPTNRPRIWITSETHCGVGSRLSYCDTLGKNYKDSVYSDIITIESSASVYSSYAGFNIHDWEGWKALSPAASDTSYPECIIPNLLGNPLRNEIIMVYPNPMKRQMTISHIMRPTSMEIITLTGRVLYKESLTEHTHTINLVETPGIYLVKFQTENSIQISKLAIE